MRPFTFNESAAPENCAALDEVADAAADAARDALPVGAGTTPPAAEEARLAADEATAAADDARLDAAAAALEALLEAEATALDALLETEAATDDTAAADEAREATEETMLAMGATMEETAGATAGAELWAAAKPARTGRAMTEKRMLIVVCLRILCRRVNVV